MTDTGTLLKVFKPQQGAYGPYRRITFQLSDGTWTQTYIQEKNRNYNNWRKIIELAENEETRTKIEGRFVEGIIMKGKIVSADSIIKPANYENVELQRGFLQQPSSITGQV